MRGLLPVLIAVALAGCGSQGVVNGPDLDRLYYPAGLEHVTVPGKTAGVLLVANANGDKRYTAGSVVAIDLDVLEAEAGLPPLGAWDGGVAKVLDLHLSEKQRALIGSFAGELHLTEIKPGAEWRAYVPTRAEGDGLFRVVLNIDDGGSPVLSCLTTVGIGQPIGQNCVPTALTTTPDQYEKVDAGLPRAPQPYGVTSLVRSCTSDINCCPTGATASCDRRCDPPTNTCIGKDGAPYSDVWVTHIAQADAPPQSGLNYASYLVHVDSDTYEIDATNFVNIGIGAANSAVALDKWVYVSGRIAATAPNLLRLVRYDSTFEAATVYEMASESAVRVSDGRALALSSDKTKLYMLARLPDSLLIADVQGPDTETPGLPITRQVPTIDAVIDLEVIPRTGKGDLIVITGATSIGSVAIYDVDSGQHVAIIRNAGAQPSHVAVDVRGNAARIFAGDFGDGRISVIDIPDLDRPQDARQVAFLGKQQVCLVLGDKAPNCKALPESER